MLDKLFNPSGVAVIGAAREPGKVGHSILKNILDCGYHGRVFPVNPKAGSVLGVRCYPDAASLPGRPDLAVVAVPRDAVLGAIRDCGKKGVGAAIVVTSGFKETGAEGHALEDSLVEAASGLGVRLLGPNCLGLINTAAPLNASFAPSMPLKGGIAFFSQSGALCTAILDWSVARGVGFSKFVSLGNKSDISELDMMEYLADDPETRVILGYIEGVDRGREFMERAWATVGKTPLIIVKAGGTTAGARAASSHTGTLAGSERAFDAAFLATGVLRAGSVEELFNLALAFANNPVPAGPGLAVVTNAGGPGIIAADAAERGGVRMAELGSGAVARLRAVLPASAGFYNPVDVLGDAGAERYGAALEAVIADPAVDGALVILTPQAMTRPVETASEVVRIKRSGDKPLMAAFMGGETIAEGVETLQKGGVAVYPYPEDGVKAFGALVRYRRARDKKPPVITRLEVNAPAARQAHACSPSAAASRNTAANTAHPSRQRHLALNATRPAKARPRPEGARRNLQAVGQRQR